MKTGNVTLSVVIKGPNGNHVAREFVSPRDQQTFVEGREGSSFALRIRNDNPYRVLAILSVDGLSVLGGEPAGSGSRGYVLAANSTLEVPGWKVDAATAAEFFFSGTKNGSDESYVVQMGHGDQNKGIIGLVAFGERTPKPLARALQARTSKGLGMSGPFRGFSASAMSGTLGVEAVKSARAQNSPVMLSMADAHEPTSSQDDGPEQTLGAGFGKAVDFETSSTSFRRGDLVAQMEIRYDDRRGLKRHGIDVDRPAPRRPQAFPADQTGCTPPPGWNR